MDRKQKKKMVVAATAVVILKSYLAFKEKETPEAEEYARRALKALRYLRNGDLKRCSQWCKLLVVTK